MTIATASRAALCAGWERRYAAFGAEAFSLREGTSATTDGWHLSAHAAVIGVPYTVHDQFGSFVERIHAGAFLDTLRKGADVHLLVNHTGLPLGRTSSGTLQLAEDARGLLYDADLDPSNPNAVALRSAVSRRDVTESSFAFKVTRDAWSSGFDARDIYSVDLHGGDVSPVTRGANPATGLPESAASLRAQLSGAALDALPDSAFAYLEPGGTKDRHGKTVPRRLRHFPIHDAAHVRNALARIAQGAAFGKQALPAVLKAAATFGIDVAAEKNAANSAHVQRAAAHGPITGHHVHEHAGMGSPHVHAHRHDRDADHAAHDHDAADMAQILAAANADVATDSDAAPNALAQLAADNDLEARLVILRLAGSPQSTSVLAGHGRDVADVIRGRSVEATVARRRRELELSKGRR